MWRSGRRQDWRFFVILAVLGGALLIGLGVMMITKAGTVPGICMILLGLALMAGAVVLFKIFFNTNMGKKDESIEVNYQMQWDSGVASLERLEDLKDKLQMLEPGQEILVRLTPEYFGLVSWKFFKKKDQYLSFVTLHKKDKTQEFFVMPTEDVEDAVKHFANVFVDHNAVNTANLIEMKRYQSVLEYYRLV